MALHCATSGPHLPGQGRQRLPHPHTQAGAATLQLHVRPRFINAVMAAIGHDSMALHCAFPIPDPYLLGQGRPSSPGHALPRHCAPTGGPAPKNQCIVPQQQCLHQGTTVIQANGGEFWWTAIEQLKYYAPTVVPAQGRNRFIGLAIGIGKCSQKTAVQSQESPCVSVEACATCSVRGEDKTDYVTSLCLCCAKLRNREQGCSKRETKCGHSAYVKPVAGLCFLCSKS
eukprot:1025907-Pelagomonas_calceolata.AAC.3